MRGPVPRYAAGYLQTDERLALVKQEERGTRLNTSTTPRERVEEKIVTFLGIKQSWWEVTSPLHAFIMDVYFVGYLLFGLQYEGHPTAIIQRAAVHLLGVSGGVMLCLLLCIHTGAFFMMIHDRYREWRDERIREAQEAQRAEREARRAAEKTVRAAAETIAQIAAWNERRLQAQENGQPFDEPMPNGHPLDIVAQLEQEQADTQAWYQRRIDAARKGEPFDEPPPNGDNSA